MSVEGSPISATAEPPNPMTAAGLLLDAEEPVESGLLLEATHAAFRARLPQVCERFGRAWLASSDRPEARLMLALALALQKRWPEAETQFRAAVAAANPDARLSMWEQWVAANFEYRELLSDALAWVAQARAAGHDSPHIEITRFRARMFLGNLDQSIDEHDAFAASRPLDPAITAMVHVDVATCSADSGAFDRCFEAIEAFDRLPPSARHPVEASRIEGVRHLCTLWARSVDAALAGLDRFVERSRAAGDPDVYAMALLHAAISLTYVRNERRGIVFLSRLLEVGRYSVHQRHVANLSSYVAAVLAALEPQSIDERAWPGESASPRHWINRFTALPEPMRWVGQPMADLAASRMANAEGSDPFPHLERGLAHARRRSVRVHQMVLLAELTQLGRADVAAPRLRELADATGSGLGDLLAREAEALVGSDARSLDAVAADAAAYGATGIAADAAAGAARLHREANRPSESFAAELLSDRLFAPLEGKVSLARNRLSPLLSAREREVVDRVAAGDSSREAAAALYISPRTVDSHLRRVYKQLDISGREDLVSLVNRFNDPATAPT